MATITTVSGNALTFHPTLNDVYTRLREIYLQGYNFPDGVWTPIPSVMCAGCFSLLCYDSKQWAQGIHLWCNTCKVPLVLSSAAHTAIEMTVAHPVIKGSESSKSEEQPARLVEREEDGKRFYALS